MFSITTKGLGKHRHGMLKPLLLEIKMFSTDIHALIMSFLLSTVTRQSTGISIQVNLWCQGQKLLSQSRELHIWDKVRRHQLAAQQEREGLKELKSCHSICPQSLTILSLSSAYFIVQCVCVVSCLPIKRGRWLQKGCEGWFFPDRFFVLSTQFVSTGGAIHSSHRQNSLGFFLNLN